MPRRVVVDAGPIVALFDADDHFHGRTVQFLQEFTGELVSTLAAVTEACYLLDFSRRAQGDCLRWIERAGLTLVELQAEDFGRMAELLDRYADWPMDFADASLVVACERLAIRDVASFDHHFSVYRNRQRQAFRNVFGTS
jgi:predicted nucleic acid-binding protein